MTNAEFIPQLETWKTLTLDCTPAERGVLFDFLILVYFLPFAGAAYEGGVVISDATVATRLGGTETLAAILSLIAKGHIQVWTPTSKAALHVSREDLVPNFPLGTLYAKRLVIEEAERLAGLAP